jgi:hypothetical protein
MYKYRLWVVTKIYNLKCKQLLEIKYRWSNYILRNNYNALCSYLKGHFHTYVHTHVNNAADTIMSLDTAEPASQGPQRSVSFIRSTKKAFFTEAWQDLPTQCPFGTRVARWHIFKPKIPIWAKFGGPWNRCFYVVISYVWPFQIYYGHLVYFRAIYVVI